MRQKPSRHACRKLLKKLAAYKPVWRVRKELFLARALGTIYGTSYQIDCTPRDAFQSVCSRENASSASFTNLAHTASLC
jgi:hypothetical protein